MGKLFSFFLLGTRGFLHSVAPGVCPPCPPHCYATAFNRTTNFYKQCWYVTINAEEELIILTHHWTNLACGILHLLSSQHLVIATSPMARSLWQQCRLSECHANYKLRKGGRFCPENWNVPWGIKEITSDSSSTANFYQSCKICEDPSGRCRDDITGLTGITKNIIQKIKQQQNISPRRLHSAQSGQVN